MPYYNRSTKGYDCFNILEQGPCSEDKWFVLNNVTLPVNGLPLGLCDQRPCSFETNPELFVLYNNTCELEFSEEPCGHNMELRLNVYGKGEVFKLNWSNILPYEKS